MFEVIKNFLKNVILYPFLIFLVLFLVYAFYSFLTYGKIYTYGNERLATKISKEFGNEYIVNIKEEYISDKNRASQIIYGNDKDFKEVCVSIYEKIEDPKSLSKGPKIEIYDYYDLGPLNTIKDYINPYKRRFSFEPVVLNEKSNVFHHKKDSIWLYDVEIINMDDDEDKEIVVKWLEYLCGSGGKFYQLVFKFHNGEYKVLTSLPETLYSSGEEIAYLTTKTKIKNLNNERIYEINRATTDDYVKFYDLDDDGSFELILAQPQNVWLWCGAFVSKENIWSILNRDPYLGSECVAYEPTESQLDLFECHFCPHQWVIGVYKYENNNWIIDNNWNSGRLFITSEKIGLHAGHGWNEKGWNLLGFMGFYYIPEWNPFFHDKTYELLDLSPLDILERDAFHLTDWSKSEILTIVEENYER